MTSSPTVIALIPARGGSKGVLRKNLAEMGGRLLIEWSIDAALSSPVVDRVVVSTDDDEIAAVARATGAEVPFMRPADLAADDTPDLPVFQHAVAELGDLPPDDVLVHLRPTSPIRPPGLIDDAVAAFVSAPDADSLRSVSPVGKSPFKMWVVAGGALQPLLGTWEDELFNQPRQVLPPVFQHDGVIDVLRVATVTEGSMSGRVVLPYFTPDGVAVDIDSARDLDVAEQLLGRPQGRAAGPSPSADPL